MGTTFLVESRKSKVESKEGGELEGERKDDRWGEGNMQNLCNKYAVQNKKVHLLFNIFA